MPQTYTVGARSRFVTLVAWMFLLIGVLGIVSGVVEQATQGAWALGLAQRDPALLPPLTRALLRFLPAVIASGVVLSGAMAVCALGLLQRLEWARRAFIALLAVTIAMNLAGLWLQQEFLQLLVDTTRRQAPLPASASEVLDGVVSAARWMAAGATLAATVALASIIRRLLSPAVRQEFA
jgi:hypothetical protein